jgi:hypothetical protein
MAIPVSFTKRGAWLKATLSEERLIGREGSMGVVCGQKEKLKHQKSETQCGVVSPGSDYHMDEKTGPVVEVFALYAG